MSSEQEPFVTGDTQVQTETRDARMTGADDRFSSKLREAFGSSPFILTKFGKFMSWVHRSSMFILQFGIVCCNIEMIYTYLVKRGLDRFAAEVPRASSRQAGMIIMPGTIVSKFAPRIEHVYNQIPEPEFIAGMESCTVSGGPFQEGYSIIKGAEEVIPVDIHIPGCPPRPKVLVYGIAKLQEHTVNGKSSLVTIKPYELEQFGDLGRNEIVGGLAEGIGEEDLVIRYNWADSP